jgi:hypothetical protein
MKISKHYLYFSNVNAQKVDVKLLHKVGVALRFFSMERNKPNFNDKIDCVEKEEVNSIGSNKNTRWIKLTAIRKKVLFLREKLYNVVLRYIKFRESVLEYILTRNNFVSKIALWWVSVIMVYKYVTQESLAGIPGEWFSVPMFFYGIICVGTHNETFLAIPLLMIFRMELSSVILTRFYHNRIWLLRKHFPLELQQTRSTWWRAAGQGIWESLDRMGRSATGITAAYAVGGMVVWKSLDLLNTIREGEQRRLDREAEDRRHHESLQADANQRQLDREAEDRRHRESLQAEARERQLDREAENRRHFSNQDVQKNINNIETTTNTSNEVD